VVQISPNTLSSSTTISYGSPPSSPPLNKSLLVSVQVAHDPISRGSEQTVFVKVSDKSNSSKPVSGARVKGITIYASGSRLHPFDVVTGSNGDIDSFKFKIGPDSKSGIFHENVDVSAKGYRSGSATKTFEVTAALPQNTTTTNMTVTNTTITLPGNNTGNGGNINSTNRSNNNETNTVFNLLIPSTGGSQNETAPQEQSGGGTNATATVDNLDHRKDDLSLQPIDGNSSSTIIHKHSHTHHNSKHKDGNDLLGGGSGNDGGGDGGDGDDGGGGSGGDSGGNKGGGSSGGGSSGGSGK
jgi:hypothetical protein